MAPVEHEPLPTTLLAREPNDPLGQRGGGSESLERSAQGRSAIRVRQIRVRQGLRKKTCKSPLSLSALHRSRRIGRFRR
jgi:hypothetical protein